MSVVQEWAKDKPYLIKIFAPHLASTVQDMHDEFRQLKLRRFATQKFTLPHLPSWFAMYRSHRRTLKQIQGVFSAVYGKKIIGAFSAMFEEASKLKKPEKNFFSYQSPLSGGI